MKVIRTVKEVADSIVHGGVVAMPTDTVYGLIAIANMSAKRRIIAIKQSPEDKKILLLVDGIVSAKKIAHITSRQKRFLGYVWPGPITVVFKSKKNIPGFRYPKLALRVPKNKMLEEIMKRTRRPLTATSANLSGRQTPRFYRAVQAHFAGKKHTPDAIFASRSARRSLPSTLITWRDDQPFIIRYGAMSEGRIRKAWAKSASKK